MQALIRQRTTTDCTQIRKICMYVYSLRHPTGGGACSPGSPRSGTERLGFAWPSFGSLRGGFGDSLLYTSSEAEPLSMRSL